MKLETRIEAMRQAALREGRPPVESELQGVAKESIRRVLSGISRYSVDSVDAVFALLDDRQPSWFPKAPSGARFCDGASTAHIGCHVGILQRGQGKSDREGRDYWIKPLRDVGAIEAVTLDSKQRVFVAGHTISKSPNSAYRLADDFTALLRAPEGVQGAMLRDWIAEEAVRTRLEMQARAAQRARVTADTKHSDLIAAVSEFYVPRFLPGFEVLYVDDGDGDRIPEGAKRNLARVGLELLLEDAMPDLLLANRETGAFWVVEAVTSDGEVDLYKVQQATNFVRRTHPTADIGFTTAYRTWKDAAGRQNRHKNLAPGSFLWILEDASRQFRVDSFE